MNVLVVDIGGSHVKILATGQPEPRRFDSGPDFTPDQLMDRVRQNTRDWQYDAVSLGYPGAVDKQGPVAEPGNLGGGWVGYDFAKAFNRPIRLVNDAALQALGSYDGGRMLFVGLGTGVGSALVVDRVVIPLELGCLPFDSGTTLADRLGKDGLKRDGAQAWRAALDKSLRFLGESFAVDYVVLGGGNAEMVESLPANVRRGGNGDAFAGGFRLWDEEVELHRKDKSRQWRVVS